MINRLRIFKYAISPTVQQSRRWLALGLVPLLGMSTVLAQETQSEAAGQRYPMFGIDTAGVFLLRNASTADVGWAFAGFRDALEEIGVDFFVDHYLEMKVGGPLEDNRRETLRRFDKLADFQDSSGIEHIWNLERANWIPREEFEPGVNLFEPRPGIHRFHMPMDIKRAYGAHPKRNFVVFDELEHMQMNNNAFKRPRASGDKPAIADTTDMDLPSAYGAILEELGIMREAHGEAGLTPVVETVWPAMHHIFARAGWVLAPKVLKEGWTPVPVALAMGAAIQYHEATGTKLWITPDLWFCGQYPGHSIDALRSALIFSHWMGVPRVYVENFDHVNVRGVIHQPNKAMGFDYASAEQGPHHPDAAGVYGSLVRYPDPDTFELTGYGEVVRWYSREYRKGHPVPYSWQDAECDIAIVRFPDSVWGQRNSRFFEDSPLGSRAVQSEPEMEAWFDIWHLLSHGVIPREGISFHSDAVKYKQASRFFVPTPATLVFDHRIGDEKPDFDFRGAKVVFVTGIEITEATRELLLQHAQKGNTIISLKHLGPDVDTEREVSSEDLTVYNLGEGSWITVDSFDHDSVRERVSPYLSKQNEMNYRFNGHEVVFRKIDRDQIQAFLNGTPVSEVVAPSRRSMWGPNRRLILKE